MSDNYNDIREIIRKIRKKDLTCQTINDKIKAQQRNELQQGAATEYIFQRKDGIILNARYKGCKISIGILGSL